ncbi:hypothetical protein [Plantactinospora sp. CA-290183]|uniref:hypothetical protein n=1 Tax=Plantactinospora sp. CA-290183 TaxID=3240006 RepID=UPI003D90B208
MTARSADGLSLTEVEQRLVEHVTAGTWLDLAGDEPVDEAAMRSWGASRTIRSSVLRDILRGRLAPDPDPHGLRLRGARIAGRLDLESLTTPVFIELHHCMLGEGLTARGARLAFLSVEGCLVEHPSEPALYGARLTAAAVFLENSILVSPGKTGTVRLAGAHLGQFDAIGTIIRNESGPALMANGLRVDEVVYFDGLNATGAGEDGAVNITNARLGGLDCSQASLRNDSGVALAAHGAQIDQDVILSDFAAAGSGNKASVDLSGMRIAGGLAFDPIRLDNTKDDQARLNVDGLTYSGLPTGISTRTWLRLLREGTPTFAAQPYQHLAAAQRGAGHDDQARRILIAQRRDQMDRRALTGRTERAWAHLTGLTLGYGYQSWRSLLGLLTVVAVAVVLAVTLGAHGGLARNHPTTSAAARCSTIERIGVGLDLGLPLIKTGAGTNCDVTSSATGQMLAVGGWILQLLAWAFATLFVAGFTSAVRKT